MNRRTAFAAAVPIAVGLVLLSAAAPTLAASDDVIDQNITWYDVNDSAPYIGDAGSSYTDLLGTGVEAAFGWTGDAFDGFVSGFAIEGSGIVWSAAPGGAGWVEGGLSSFNYAGTAPGFDPDFAMDATLEVQGNYARWTFVQTAGPSGTLSFEGNLGSDSDETTTIVTPNSAVVTSDDNAADPVVGYWFSGANGILDAGDGSGEAEWTAATTAPVIAVVALQDYAPCAENTAVAEMVARVPALNTVFGETIEGALQCATVATPAELTLKTAATQSLAVTIDPAVDAWLQDPWQVSSRSGYLADTSVVGSAFLGTPAGMALAFDPATSQVTMSGTPTAAGTYQVTLVLYLTDVDDYANERNGNGYPITAPFTVTVAGLTLADTGVSSAAPFVALGGALSVVGGVALLALRRRHLVR